jgi:hypothetical protein
MTELSDLLDLSQFRVANRGLAAVEALLIKEVVHSVRHGNKKAAFCSDFFGSR